MTHGTKAGSGSGLKDCIENCTECAAVCAETVQYCLEKGGDHAAPAHVRLLLDCIDICRTSAAFMIRGSELHAETCRACAEVCARCADECSRFDDERMEACAEACRRCAESCRAMASG